jgi:hypothetical protein
LLIGQLAVLFVDERKPTKQALGLEVDRAIFTQALAWLAIAA